MRAKMLLVVLLTLTGIMAAGLAGCSTNGAAAADVQPVSVNVGSQQQGIWVSGQGKVTVTPDIALLSLGVSAQADKVVEAQAQAAVAMDKVITGLKSLGVAEKDIQTTYFSIQALTRYDSTTQQSIITGYVVSNAVSVRIRDIENVGQVIDAVAQAGGDNTRIDGISFSVDSPEQYYPQAREMAMNDAKNKAQKLAELAGVVLGPPTYVTESAASPPVPYPIYGRAEAGAPVPPTSISAGVTDIILNVQVTYAIQ